MFALCPADIGITAAEVRRKMGISEAAYYKWKKKYGGFGVFELHRLKQLEEQNEHLIQLVDDPNLDKQMLKDVLRKRSEARTTSAHGSHLNDAYRIPAH